MEIELMFKGTESGTEAHKAVLGELVEIRGEMLRETNYCPFTVGSSSRADGKAVKILTLGPQSEHYIQLTWSRRSGAPVLVVEIQTFGYFRQVLVDEKELSYAYATIGVRGAEWL